MSSLKKLPSLSKLNSYLDYFPETGKFIWKERNNSHFNSLFAGKVAGSTNSKGYIVLKIDGRSCKAHRVAWKMFYGSDPRLEIDHKDGKKDNNAISNLREASPQENSRNCSQKRNNGLPKGVHKQKNKYVSQICVNYVRVYLGIFRTAEEAHEAYVEKSKEIFGEFACHSR